MCPSLLCGCEGCGGGGIGGRDITVGRAGPPPPPPPPPQSRGAHDRPRAFEEDEPVLPSGHRGHGQAGAAGEVQELVDRGLRVEALHLLRTEGGEDEDCSADGNGLHQHRISLMTRRIIAIVLFLTVAPAVFAQQAIPTPDEYLGYTLGERFTPWTRIDDYFNELAKHSSQI